MLLITHDFTDPYFNLASEEYLLTGFEDDIIYLWRNDNAVIVGRHQNTLEEINQAFVRKHDISVVRRMSGGGAVYHDINNINYSVFMKYEADLFSNYGFFTEPICAYLNELGVNAQLNGRNDITIEGLKFSGNAQAVRGGRIMHHGTLLFRSDPAVIEGALNPPKMKIESKGIKSVRSRITDISSHLKDPVTTEEFMKGLCRHFENGPDSCTPYVLSDHDIRQIRALAEKKYSTWEWNYGSSPKYTYANSRKYDFGIVDVRMNVSGGIIDSIHIYGDFFSIKGVSGLEAALTGCRHTEEDIRKALSACDVGACISHMDREQLAELILGTGGTGL